MKKTLKLFCLLQPFNFSQSPKPAHSLYYHQSALSVPKKATLQCVPCQLHGHICTQTHSSESLAIIVPIGASYQID